MSKKKKTETAGERKPNWKEYMATVEDIQNFLMDRVLLRYNVITGRVEYRLPDSMPPKLGGDRGLNEGMSCACSDPQPPNLGGLWQTFARRNDRVGHGYTAVCDVICELLAACIPEITVDDVLVGYDKPALFYLVKHYPESGFGFGIALHSRKQAEFFTAVDIYRMTAEFSEHLVIVAVKSGEVAYGYTYPKSRYICLSGDLTAYFFGKGSVIIRNEADTVEYYPVKSAEIRQLVYVLFSIGIVLEIK